MKETVGTQGKTSTEFVRINGIYKTESTEHMTEKSCLAQKSRQLQRKHGQCIVIESSINNDNLWVNRSKDEN